jgi:hypothetical protein
MKPRQPVIWFEIRLNGKMIDEIPYTENNISEKEVYKSLVYHDGYNPNIKVIRLKYLPIFKR